MCRIMDPDTFLLSLDFPIEIGGNAIAKSHDLKDDLKVLRC